MHIWRNLKVSFVNAERCERVNDSLGGHLVNLLSVSMIFESQIVKLVSLEPSFWVFKSKLFFHETNVHYRRVDVRGRGSGLGDQIVWEEHVFEVLDRTPLTGSCKNEYPCR